MTLAVKDATGATVNLSTYVDGASEHNPRHSIITAEGAGATIGTTADAAVSTDTTGTLSSKIRGIVKILADVLGLAADAAATMGGTGTISAKLRQMSTDIGASADAAVSYSSTASLSSRVRQVSFLLNSVNTNLSTVQGDVNSTLTVNGATGDAAVTTNTTGTISGKLRGIVGLLAAAIDITNGFMKSQLIPWTSGGLSNYHVVSAGSTNVANIKASAGQVYSITVYNNAAYPVYVKLHNTSGTPTAGSGVVRTVGVPAGGGNNWNSDIGVAFSSGIGISILKDITDAGTTAVLASDCVVDVMYK
jgi:hypothetical protein